MHTHTRIPFISMCVLIRFVWLLRKFRKRKKEYSVYGTGKKTKILIEEF